MCKPATTNSHAVVTKTPQKSMTIVDFTKSLIVERNYCIALALSGTGLEMVKYWSHLQIPPQAGFLRG